MKRLFVPFFSLLIVLVVAVSGCASRPQVSEDEFSAACTAAQLEAVDSTAQFDSNVATKVLTASTDNFSAGYFVFKDNSTARTNYAQMLSSVATGSGDEKQIDSSEYNRFEGVSGDTQTLLYRNGSTLIYITGADVMAYSAMTKSLGL